MTSNKKLTVLQVVPRINNKFHNRTLLDLINFLVSRDLRVIAISPCGKISELLNHGAVFAPSEVLSFNPLLIFFSIWKIARGIRKYEVDILHAHTPCSFWLCKLALALSGKRGKVSFVNSMHIKYPGGILGRLYFANLNVVDSLIVSSEAIRDYVLLNHAISAEKISLIEPGVDLSYFDSKKIRPDRIFHLTKIWNIPEYKKVVLFPPGSIGTKNYKPFLKAITMLKRDDFICVIIGENIGSSLRAAINESIVSYGISNVELISSASDMPAAYFTASLVACLSLKEESFARSLIEVMAMRKVIIADRRSMSSSVVEHGKNGFLVDANSAQELAEAIDKVLSMSDKDRTVIEKNALASVKNRFSHLTMCDKILNLYLGIRNN
jgi:glycosyltransferase involved in cell wall biosynthesis